MSFVLSRLDYCNSLYTRVCRYKTVLLSREKYACRDKQNYVCRDKIFLSQQKFGRNKHVFVATTKNSPQAYFCRDKNIFGKRLLRQKYFVATDMILFVATKYFCRNKRLVATNTCLSRQKFCHHKHTFVATKIFVAAPANDRFPPCAIVAEINLLLPTCQTSLFTSLLALCVLQAPVCSVSMHETQQVWKTCFLKHRTSGLEFSLSPNPIYAVLQVFPSSDPIRKRSSYKSICADDIHSGGGDSSVVRAPDS